MVARWLLSAALALLAIASASGSGHVNIAYSNADQSYTAYVRADKITGYLDGPFTSLGYYNDINFAFDEVHGVSGEVYGASTDAHAVLSALTSEVERSANFIQSGQLAIAEGDLGVRVDFTPTIVGVGGRGYHFVPNGNWSLLLVFKRVAAPPGQRFALRSQALKLSVSWSSPVGADYVGVWATPSSAARDGTDWHSDIYVNDCSAQTCAGYNCSNSRVDFKRQGIVPVELNFLQLQVGAQLNSTLVGGGLHGGAADRYGQCKADVARRRDPPPRPHHRWCCLGRLWSPLLSSVLHWMLMGAAVYMVCAVLKRWRREWAERKRLQAQQPKVAYIVPTAANSASGTNPGDAPLYIIPPPQYSVHDNTDGGGDAEKSDAGQLAFV